MAYSNVSDIQKLYANIVFDASSPVTSADIETKHIPKADAYIDARLRSRYETPISADSDMELMRLISSNLAAGFVAEVLYETSQQPNDQASARQRRGFAEGLLDQIMTGTAALETPRKPLAGIVGAVASSARGGA